MFEKIVTDLSSFVMLNFKKVALGTYSSASCWTLCSQSSENVRSFDEVVLKADPLALGYNAKVPENHFNCYTSKVAQTTNNFGSINFKILGIETVASGFKVPLFFEGSRRECKDILFACFEYDKGLQDKTRDGDLLKFEFYSPDQRDHRSSFTLLAAPVDAVLALQFCCMLAKLSNRSSTPTPPYYAFLEIAEKAPREFNRQLASLNISDQVSLSMQYKPIKLDKEGYEYKLEKTTMLTDRVALEVITNKVYAGVRVPQLYTGDALAKNALVKVYEKIEELLSGSGASRPEQATSLMQALGALQGALGMSLDFSVGDPIIQLQQLVRKVGDLKTAMDKIEVAVNAPSGADAAEIYEQVLAVAKRAQGGYQDGQVAELRVQLEKLCVDLNIKDKTIVKLSGRLAKLQSLTEHVDSKSIQAAGERDALDTVASEKDKAEFVDTVSNVSTFIEEQLRDLFKFPEEQAGAGVDLPEIISLRDRRQELTASITSLTEAGAAFTNFVAENQSSLSARNNEVVKHLQTYQTAYVAYTKALQAYLEADRVAKFETVKSEVVNGFTAKLKETFSEVSGLSDAVDFDDVCQVIQADLAKLNDALLVIQAELDTSNALNGKKDGILKAIWDLLPGEKEEYSIDQIFGVVSDFKDGIEEHLTTSEAELAQLNVAIVDKERSIAALTAVRDEKLSELSAKQEALASSKTELEAEKAKYHELDAQYKELEATSEQNLTELAAAKREKAASPELNDDLQKVTDELEKVKESLKTSEIQNDRCLEMVSEAEVQKRLIQSQLSEAQEELRKLHAELSENQKAAEQLEKVNAELTQFKVEVETNNQKEAARSRWGSIFSSAVSQAITTFRDTGSIKLGDIAVAVVGDAADFAFVPDLAVGDIQQEEGSGLLKLKSINDGEDPSTAAKAVVVDYLEKLDFHPAEAQPMMHSFPVGADHCGETVDELKGVQSLQAFHDVALGHSQTISEQLASDDADHEALDKKFATLVAAHEHVKAVHATRQGKLELVREAVRADFTVWADMRGLHDELDKKDAENKALQYKLAQALEHSHRKFVVAKNTIAAEKAKTAAVQAEFQELLNTIAGIINLPTGTPQDKDNILGNLRTQMAVLAQYQKDGAESGVYSGGSDMSGSPNGSDRSPSPVSPVAAGQLEEPSTPVAVVDGGHLSIDGAAPGGSASVRFEVMATPLRRNATQLQLKAVQHCVATPYKSRGGKIILGSMEQSNVSSVPFSSDDLSEVKDCITYSEHLHKEFICSFWSLVKTRFPDMKEPPKENLLESAIYAVNKMPSGSHLHKDLETNESLHILLSPEYIEQMSNKFYPKSVADRTIFQISMRRKEWCGDCYSHQKRTFGPRQLDLFDRLCNGKTTEEDAQRVEVYDSQVHPSQKTDLSSK